MASVSCRQTLTNNMANTTTTSGPDYQDAHDAKYGKPHLVPLKIATEDNIKQYGRFVTSFEEEEVWIATWPQQGWRPICPGTGNQGGIVEGDFLFQWEDDFLKARNKAVGRAYVTGRLPVDVTSSRRSHVLVRDLNYHPDGGQVFFPEDGKPFVALLALPGDDIKLEHFEAFYFDGSFGLQIKPGVWHQSPYPLEDSASFKNKQGRVHACVEVDTAVEFGRYLKVPLFKSLSTA